MARIMFTYASLALRREVTIQVILPTDKRSDGVFSSSYAHETGEKYKTLILLHGLTMEGTEWLRDTDIEHLAEELDIAVLMPNGENSFYVPGVTPNSDFGEFVGQEVLTIARKSFPLSNKREDTFIAGESMGGFGALRNGLKYSDTFSKILSFSAAIHMFEFEPGDPRRQMVCHEDGVMGKYEEAVLTEKNPAVCLQHLKDKVDEGAALFPEIYMVCGTDDTLIDANRSFRDKLLKVGAPLIYEEAPGIHHFSFWNQYVPQMVHWLVE